MRFTRLHCSAAALFLASAAVAVAQDQEPCCTVTGMELAPEPCCAIITARDARTGETFQFRIEGAAAESLRLRQSVGLDPSRQWALVGSQRLRLIAAPRQLAQASGPRPASVPSPASSAVSCTAVSVNGSTIVAGSTLTVTVNGEAVATYDQYASGELGQYLQPGVNRVGLSFAAPGTMGPFGTQAEIRCMRPGSTTGRDEILRLQPTRARLSAEVAVNYVPS